VKHKAETIVHGKPIDLTNIRTAINDRSSIAFWRSRKQNPTKRFVQEEDEEEMNEEQGWTNSDHNDFHDVELMDDTV